LKIEKAKHGSGYLYDGIYSRYGLKCFKCIFGSKIIENVVFCTIHFNEDFKENGKYCIEGKKIKKRSVK